MPQPAGIVQSHTTADSLKYDGANRLIRQTTKANLTGQSDTALNWTGGLPPAREITYRYDYLGRRVEKVSRLDGQTVFSRRYVYEGWNLIAEFVVEGGNPILRRSYLWGLDLASSLDATGGVGALVLETLHTATGLTTYSVANDGNGNVTALIDTNGAAAALYEYDAFGQLLRADGAPTAENLAAPDTPGDNPFRFSSKYWERESHLLYYGHRFYEPSLGRFINRDPSGEAGGLNLYGFCGGDGVNGYDYLGLSFGSFFKRLFGLDHQETAGCMEQDDDHREAVEYIDTPFLGLDASDPAYKYDEIAEPNSFKGILSDYDIQKERANMHAKNREDKFRLMVLRTDDVVLGENIGTLDYIGYWPEFVAADLTAWWESSSALEKVDMLMLLTTRGRTGTAPRTSTGVRFVPSGNGRLRMADARAGALFPRPKTLRTFLTPKEQAEFVALQAKHPDWMPRTGLDTPVNIRSVAETASARSLVEGRGHHRHPLKFDGEPNPREGLVQTGETRTEKNPTHTEVSNFWMRVLRRLQSKSADQ